MLRPVLLLLACLIVQPALAPIAHAQIQRCVGADGNSIYTDRSCDSLDAVPRGAPESAGGATLAGYAGGFATRGCARNPDALLDGVRNALEAQDVNRLASYYHWTGVGNGSAKVLMDRLESIARHPLVAADLIFPSPAPMDAYSPADPYAPSVGNGEPATPSRGEPGRSSWTAGLYPTSAPAAPARSAPQPEPTIAAESLEPPADAPPPLPAPDAVPHGIRVYQAESQDDFAARSTHFQLRRNAGCWWIQL